MNQTDQFLKNKVAEMRRAAPDCDVWLYPEAEGYTGYSQLTYSGAGTVVQKPVPLPEVKAFIDQCTSSGLNVALLDRVSLGQHGGWKTILIAKIPATIKPQAEDDFA